LKSLPAPSARAFASDVLSAFEESSCLTPLTKPVVVRALVPTSASLSTYTSCTEPTRPPSSSRLYEITEGKSASL